MISPNHVGLKPYKPLSNLLKISEISASHKSSCEGLISAVGGCKGSVPAVLFFHCHGGRHDRGVFTTSDHGMAL